MEILLYLSVIPLGLAVIILLYKFYKEREWLPLLFIITWLMATIGFLACLLNELA